LRSPAPLFPLFVIDPGNSLYRLDLKLPHRHVALSDAIEQGQLFCNLLAEARARLAGE